MRITRCNARTTTGTGGSRGGGRRCQRWTTRHPFCAQHAKQLLGIVVRRAAVHGCGLFTTRPFRAGDVIVPYTGERGVRRVSDAPTPK